MAYEHLELGLGNSKRLAAHRIANGTDPHTGIAEDGSRFGRLPALMHGSSRTDGLRLSPEHVKPRAAANPSAVKAAPVAQSASTARYSQADIGRAVARALAGERARIANVFASQASRGKERVCAKLLSNPAGWPSAAIIAELPSLPNDATVAGRGGFTRNSTAKVGTKAAAKPVATSVTASDVWDRALGKARPAATVAERAWEGAISNITRATARA